MEDAFALANEIAPEHLELLIENPESFLDQIRNAGAVFLGKYSPEPVGDYYAGPNHTLPTNGSARFFSALSVHHFTKSISVIQYSEKALEKVYKDIALFAESEGLFAHAQSVRSRFDD